MMRPVAIALLALGLAFPAGAQRPASHGGGSAHSAPTFHGGFSPPAAHGFSSAPHYGGSRPAYRPHTYRPGTFNNFPPRNGNGGHAPSYGGHSSNGGHGGDHDRGRYRHVYISPYGYGYGYGPVLGLYGPGYLGYPDDFSADDSQDPGQGYAGDGSDGYGGYADDAGPVPGYDPNYGPGPPDGYGPVAPTPGPPQPRVPYRPSPSVPESQAPAVLQGEGAVTLVFKDGRPTEQIRNYLLTPTTLYIGGEHHREIPLDQIDIAATEDANRDTGLDFHLPPPAN